MELPLRGQYPDQEKWSLNKSCPFYRENNNKDYVSILPAGTKRKVPLIWRYSFNKGDKFNNLISSLPAETRRSVSFMEVSQSTENYISSVLIWDDNFCQQCSVNWRSLLARAHEKRARAAREQPPTPCSCLQYRRNSCETKRQSLFSLREATATGVCYLNLSFSCGSTCYIFNEKTISFVSPRNFF